MSNSKYKEQIYLLGRIIIARDLLKELPIKLHSVCNDYTIFPTQYVIDDVKIESLRMYIVNYLTALIGKRKNDQLSFYNVGSEKHKQRIDEFVKEYEKEYNYLIAIRDKIYSHYDGDKPILEGVFNSNFTDRCIDLVKDLIYHT